MNAPQETGTADRLAQSLRTPGLAARVAPFVDARALSSNHVQLVDILGHAAQEADLEVLLAAALVLSAQERGHSALSLHPELLPRMVPARPTDPNEADAVTAGLPWPRWEDLEDRLVASPLLQSDPALLCLHAATHMGPALQTHRLDREEQWVAEALQALCAPVPASEADFLRLTDTHRQLAGPLFKSHEKPDPNHVALKVLDALRDARLGIVTGGPGTGKTWSIKRILSVFHAAAASQREGASFTVALAAPTGKAGVRMREAMQEELEELVDDLRGSAAELGLAVDAEKIRGELVRHRSFTLHKLLGIRPGEGSARHHAGNPLPYDLVVVDEASMADLPMMRRLLQAIGPRTRLVLLGDRDQLPSVDVGAVLADIVSPTHGKPDAELPVAWFRTNHRSKNAQTLADLVAALQSDAAGAMDQAMDMLMGRQVRAASEGTPAERLPTERIRRLAPPRPTSGGATPEHAGTHAELVTKLLKPWKEDLLEKTVTTTVQDGEQTEEVTTFEREKRKGYVKQLAELLEGVPHGASWKDVVHAKTDDLFAAFDAYRVLAVHRKGPLGVAGLGAALEKQIRRTLEEAWQKRPGGRRGASSDDRLPTQNGKWLGQAILITRNDSDLAVFNGDVGLVLPMPLDPSARSVDSSRKSGTSGKSGKSETSRSSRPLALALPRIPDPDKPEDTARFRYISLSRLPEHESAFVMTVHKSQGSQFAHTAVVLADRASSIQTRELVYTGITRAKQKVTWVGTEATLRAALETRVLRGSRLEQRISGEEPASLVPSSGGSSSGGAFAGIPSAGISSAGSAPSGAPSPGVPSPELPAHYDGLHSFLLKNLPVDGTTISRTKLNKRAKTARGMSPAKLEALLHSEPRLEHLDRSWRLREVAPVQPGSPLDRATRAVLQSATGLSGKQIQAEAGLSKEEWIALRPALVQQPAVESVGFRRGARYLPKAYFDAQWAETEARLWKSRDAKPHAKTVRAALADALGRLNER